MFIFSHHAHLQRNCFCCATKIKSNVLQSNLKIVCEKEKFSVKNFTGRKIRYQLDFSHSVALVEIDLIQFRGKSEISFYGDIEIHSYKKNI